MVSTGLQRVQGSGKVPVSPSAFQKLGIVFRPTRFIFFNIKWPRNGTIPVIFCFQLKERFGILLTKFNIENCTFYPEIVRKMELFWLEKTWNGTLQGFWEP